LPTVGGVPTTLERDMITNPHDEVHFRTHSHHHNHRAVLAVTRADGHGVGAARYIRHAHDHQSADVEVSVDDAWEGTGVGAELLRRLLEHARGDGVRRIVMVLPAEPARRSQPSPAA
jgi:GNAT superfamily N-acetyltransferase